MDKKQFYRNSDGDSFFTICLWCSAEQAEYQNKSSCALACPACFDKIMAGTVRHYENSKEDDWTMYSCLNREGEMIQAMRCHCLQCGETKYFETTKNTSLHKIAQKEGWRMIKNENAEHWKRVIKGWQCPECKSGKKKRSFVRKTKSKFVRKEKSRFTRKTKSKFVRKEKT